MKQSIFVRIFLALLISSLIILTIMAAMIVFAIQTSIAGWNEGKREELQALLIPIISKTHRLNGELSENNLEKALSQYMTDSLYVYILDREKRPVYILNQGRRILLKELGKEKPSIQSLINQTSPVQISDGDLVIGFLAADSVDFLSYKANRQFVETMKKAVTIGTLIAVSLALLISITFSSTFSKQASSLVSGLRKLSGGVRNVVFPEMSTNELNAISLSAIELQNQLSKEEFLRQQWMQDISHDLRTPITAIMAQFEAMTDGVLDIIPERILGLMTELKRVEQLVVNLQELSRYESPEMKITIDEIDSTQFLDEIKERFSFLSQQKGIKLSCFSEPFGLRLDEHLMQRCLSNIVQNALQNTQPLGSIEIALKSYQGFSVFTIANTGEIPEEHIHHIFDRLYRGNPARSGSQSGLGLSIAKVIAELHNGDIQAANIGGKAVFTLTLPS